MNYFRNVRFASTESPATGDESADSGGVAKWILGGVAVLAVVYFFRDAGSMRGQISGRYRP